MKQVLILAIVAAFSNTAFANDSKVADTVCPAGTKLVRGAEITITKDGSGTLVERDSCKPQEQPAQSAKDIDKTN